MPSSPYQYQNLGANNFAVQANPSPAAYPTLGNVTAASRVAGATPPPASTPAPSGLNTTAGSKSINPFGIGAPDLSAGDPNILNRLDISNLIYSLPAGGYITQDQANSGYTGPATSNQKASQYFAYVGSLPTVGRGSPALMQLGGGPSRGPSYNSILGGLFQNASPIALDRLKKGGFSPTYKGPNAF